MLFMLKSYRAFATLVGLFLLVGQVAAVPPAARRPPAAQNVNPINPNHLGAFLGHGQSYKTRMKAAREHVKVHNANLALARQHERFAAGVSSEQNKGTLHQVARLHKEVARTHLNKAKSHFNLAQRHRYTTIGSNPSAFDHLITEGQASIGNSKVLRKHAKMLSSAMTAAEEHRMAQYTHTRASELAAQRGRQAVSTKHLSTAADHKTKAYEHVTFAVQNVLPRPLVQTTVDQKISLADHSATHARISNALADKSIKRLSRAAPANPAPAH